MSTSSGQLVGERLLESEGEIADPARAHELSPRWGRLALLPILALSALLSFLWLEREGYSNLYYAATVKSMLTSWHNFFYASYDPGGFVTVDKPPLGFWLQAASARLFGFSGLSLLLPGALASVLSVALLYHLVRRSAGEPAGLLAALLLALSPISVATSRNNTVDMLLVLTLLLGAWAIARAAERGSLRWLLLAMIFIGLGFNIKMLQAYLVLPAFYLLYLLVAPLSWLRRLAHLALATLLLLGVSLSWALAVELTPPEQRPYVGGSKTNSVLELALGYNGIQRLLGNEPGGLASAPVPQPVTGAPGQPTPDAGLPGQRRLQPPGAQQQTQGPGGGPGCGAPMVNQPPGAPAPAFTMSLSCENGEPGPLRLVNRQLGGQIGWLLPLALIGVLGSGFWVLGCWTALRTRAGQALPLWGGWLLPQLVFFSIAGFWHRYYLVVLAPAVAALAAMALASLWRTYREGRLWWLLPLVLGAMAAFQLWLLRDYPEQSGVLAPALLGLASMALLLLVAARLLGGLRAGPISRVGLAAGLLALLAAPAAWDAITIAEAPGEMLPAAGPSDFAMGMLPPGPPGDGPGGPPDGGRGPVVLLSGPPSEDIDPALIGYLQSNRGDARFLAATMSAAGASPIILATGEPVMALGGFGGDRILDQPALERLVAQGVVRFFLLPGDNPPPADGNRPPPPGGPGGPRLRLGGPGSMQEELVGWVRQQCRLVPAEQWRSSGDQPGDVLLGAMPSMQALYDCRP